MARDMAGFWNQCRVTFRWCRFVAWFLILAALLALLWLNQAGLPGFLKTRLVAALNQRGVTLEYARMRLSLTRGLVAEEVRIGNAGRAGDLACTVHELQLQLDYPALLRRQWQLDGLKVRDGTLTLAASPHNQLTLTKVQSDWRFEAGDTWVLENLQADFDGVRVSLSGELRHAADLHPWPAAVTPNPGGGTGASRTDLARFLRQIAAVRSQWHLAGQPWVNVFVDGDARDFHSFSIRAEARLPGVQNAGFSADDLRLAARLAVRASAPPAAAGWGFWTNLQPFSLEYTLRAAGLRLDQLTLDTLAIGGDWQAPRLAVKSLTAQIAAGRLNASAALDVASRRLDFTNDSVFDPHQLAGWLTPQARARWAGVLWTTPPRLAVAGSLTLPPWTQHPPDWPAAVAPTVRLAGQLAFSNAVVGGQTLDYLRTGFQYALRHWTLSGLEVAQGRTRLAFDGEADEPTHTFQGRLRGSLAAASLRPFLAGTPAGRVLDRFAFHEPLTLELRLHGDWRDWQDATAAGSGTLRDVCMVGPDGQSLVFEQLQTAFSCSNQCWQLSGLQLVQGRTRADGQAWASPADGRFSASLRGAFDAATLQPFLTSAQAVAGLGLVRLAEPLAFQVNAAGNWRHPAAITAQGSLALTNFSVRGQPADRVASQFAYHDGRLVLLHPGLVREQGSQSMTADSVTLDFSAGRISFTNGYGTMDPLYVVRCIGPKITDQIEPYHFPEPPEARVNGCAPMRDVPDGDPLADADLTFVMVKPAPFRWQNLRSTGVTGVIHWRGQELILTGLRGEVYGGRGRGGAHFYFTPGPVPTDFQFQLAVTNVNLHLLAADLSSPTNKLQGLLSGFISVTNANTGSWQSWNGEGQAGLRNGLLWNIPIFGLASDALNLFAPGLGNSRATDATVSFGLTNGVLYSKLLELHTPTMRLQYSGTVDLMQHVNARVTAQLLRNVPVVGSIVSTMLSPVSKIFECQVGGRLDDPKITPLWLPTPVSDFLLLPLHPLRSLQDMFN